MGSKVKYHPLVPQIYMKLWCSNRNSIIIFYKDNLKENGQRNIANIGGRTNFHTIKVGLRCCTEEDLDKIFMVPDNYVIKIGGKQISSSRELSSEYHNFDD